MSTLDLATIDRATVEAFLFKEARLCDEGLYDAWGELWTDDGVYWVPVNENDYDPREHLSIIYDDRAQLQDRLDRLKSGKAWSQEPKSRMCRVVGNVELGAVLANGGLEVYSKYTLGEVRSGLQTTYFARVLHHLRNEPDGLRMALKKVMLVNNDEPLHNVTFLL